MNFHPRDIEECLKVLTNNQDIVDKEKFINLIYEFYDQKAFGWSLIYEFWWKFSWAHKWTKFIKIYVTFDSNLNLNLLKSQRWFSKNSLHNFEMTPRPPQTSSSWQLVYWHFLTAFHNFSFLQKNFSMRNELKSN